jgi:hypothetical protein
MAQLPDENIIALPQPGSRRTVSTIDVSGYARGAAAIGSGTERLGRSIRSAAQDVAAVVRHEREADDKVELARARGYLNTALINYLNAIDKETKADGLVETYTTRVNDAVEVAANAISNSRSREIFTLNAQDGASRVINVAKSKSFYLTRDAGIATDIDTLNRLRLTAAAGGPEVAKVFVDTVHGYLDAWQTKAWIDETEAAQIRKFQAEDFARLKLVTLPPKERLEALHRDATSRYRVLADILPAEVREQLRVAAEHERPRPD